MEFLSFEKLISCDTNSSLDVKHRLRLLYVESSSFYSSLIDQDSKDAKLGLAYINKSLNDPYNRLDGLQLLSVFVNQTSNEIILNNFREWIQHLRSFILHDNKLDVRLLAAKTLSKIISCCQVDPDHSRYLVQNLVPNIIPRLLALDDKWLLVVVHLLKPCLTHFPGPCRPFMSGIQRKLLDCLASNELEIVELAAMCIARIPFVCASGERGLTPALAWSDFFQKLLQTLHSFLNSIYKNFEIEEYSHIDLSEQIPLPVKLLENNSTCTFVDSYHRFISICLCLEKMLKNGDAVALSIPIENILKLIGRVVRVTGKSLMDSQDSPQKKLILTILPMIHSSALGVLEALIICCRRHLLLHDHRILNILQHSLNWPSTVWKTNKNAVSKLRCTAYGVLITWLKVMGSATDISTVSDLLMKRLISDAFQDQIAAEKSMTKLPVSTTPMTKKRKVEQYFVSSTSNNSNCAIEEELCYSALKALQVVIYNCNQEIKPSVFKDLLTKVMDKLSKFQYNVDLSSDFPFLDVRCRKALYKLLVALISSQTCITHPILSKSITIISNGCLDKHFEVAQYCLQAKQHCHGFIEPVRRYLPMRVSTISTALNNLNMRNVVEEEALQFDADEPLEIIGTNLNETSPNEESEDVSVINYEARKNITEIQDTVVDIEQRSNEYIEVNGKDGPSNGLQYSSDDQSIIISDDEDEVVYESSSEMIKDLKSQHDDTVEMTEDKENVAMRDNDATLYSSNKSSPSGKNLVISENPLETDDETKLMISSFVLSDPDKTEIQ
ncbi:hypothetical protein CHUAL_003794 [Chamberlinius hualienensis]